MKTNLAKPEYFAGVPLLLLALLMSTMLHALFIFGIAVGGQMLIYRANKDLVFQVDLKTDPVIVDTENTVASASVGSELKAVKKSEMPLINQEDALSMPINPIVEDRYYKARELDEVPKPLSEIQLSYPQLAREQGVAGSVRLELFISEKGEVVSINVLSETTPGIFGQAAISAFEKQRFVPGTINGQAVKSHMTLTVNFSDDLLPQ